MWFTTTVLDQASCPVSGPVGLKAGLASAPSFPHGSVWTGSRLPPGVMWAAGGPTMYHQQPPRSEPPAYYGAPQQPGSGTGRVLWIICCCCWAGIWLFAAVTTFFIPLILMVPLSLLAIFLPVGTRRGSYPYPPPGYPQYQPQADDPADQYSEPAGSLDQAHHGPAERTPGRHRRT